MDVVKVHKKEEQEKEKRTVKKKKMRTQSSRRENSNGKGGENGKGEKTVPRPRKRGGHLVNKTDPGFWGEPPAFKR